MNSSIVVNDDMMRDHLKILYCFWLKYVIEHCWHCSNYSFILNWTPGFNGLGKGNCKMRWETLKFWDLVQVILEIWHYNGFSCAGPWGPCQCRVVGQVYVWNCARARNDVSSILLSYVGWEPVFSALGPELLGKMRNNVTILMLFLIGSAHSQNKPWASVNKTF